MNHMNHIQWKQKGQYTDIEYATSTEGIAKITINRPEVHNAFRPLTVKEMITVLADARYDASIGVIILTGKGDKAFCSGGDQKIRGKAGYTDEKGIMHLNVLDLQRNIPSLPETHHCYGFWVRYRRRTRCCTWSAIFTIAADNAIFGQTGPKVGSFDWRMGS